MSTSRNTASKSLGGWAFSRWIHPPRATFLPAAESRNQWRGRLLELDGAFFRTKPASSSRPNAGSVEPKESPPLEWRSYGLWSPRSRSDKIYKSSIEGFTLAPIEFLGGPIIVARFLF